MKFVRRDPRLLSELSDGAFTSLVADLVALSDTGACAAFGAQYPSATVVICLCGWEERFKTIAMIRGIAYPALVVQDPAAPWFTGSPLCTGIEAITQAIRELFPHATRWLFTGQSSGAYAALVLSRHFSNSIAIAVSPQTFDDHALKQEIIFPSGFAISTTPAVIDVRELFLANPHGVSNTTAWVLAAFSEAENPPQGYFWIDAWHWSRLAGLPDIRIMVLDMQRHHVLFRHARVFAALIGAVASADDWTDGTVAPILRAALDAPPVQPVAAPAGSAAAAAEALRALGEALGDCPAEIALMLVEHIIAGHDTDAALLHGAGTALRRARQDQAAASYFLRAITTDPDLYYSAVELGEIASLNGDSRAAREWFSYALRYAPTNPHVVQVAARHEARSGQMDYARAILEQAQARDPTAEWVADARRSLGEAA